MFRVKNDLSGEERETYWNTMTDSVFGLIHELKRPHTTFITFNLLY